MFGFGKDTRKIEVVKKLLQHNEGGLYKRIDENRELLQLIQEKAPEFLKENGWIEGWLRSQDNFLSALIEPMDIPNPNPSRRSFPRAWPTNDGPKYEKPVYRTIYERLGLHFDTVFRIIRIGGDDPWPAVPYDIDQVLQIIESYGLDVEMDESRVAEILAGSPFAVEGGEIRFEAIRLRGATKKWAAHAHPLKTITIKLQGTRHCDVPGMLSELDVAVQRISAGELKGERSDDDSGYKFVVEHQSQGPSIFGDKPFS